MSDNQVIWELDAIIREGREISARQVEGIAAKIAPLVNLEVARRGGDEP